MHFARPALALELAKELNGQTLLSDASNGLFLAAARRTGKTEFLKQDLRPALEALGILVIYVDLWANKSRAPMEVIAEALALAAGESLGLVAKAARATGLDSINVAGIKIDTSKIGKTDGMSLHAVLSLIRKQTGKKIALIVDEAQHALTSAEGDSAMSALKSARDQMRDADGAGLLLIMSGSHRDKLMRLLNTKAAPFWGSSVRALPTLGRDFIEQVARELRVAWGMPIDGEMLMHVFKLCAESPQFLAEAIQDARLAANGDIPKVEQVLEIAQQRRQRDRDGLSSVYRALGALEQAIFWRLLDKTDAFKPFDAASIAFYSLHTSKKVTVAQAQKAMEKLRDNDPPLVWKSLRGEYSLYDVDMLDWYAYLVAQQAWPPAIQRPA
jgi:hypothetical protein